MNETQIAAASTAPTVTDPTVSADAADNAVVDVAFVAVTDMTNMSTITTITRPVTGIDGGVEIVCSPMKQEVLMDPLKNANLNSIEVSGPSGGFCFARESPRAIDCGLNKNQSRTVVHLLAGHLN